MYSLGLRREFVARHYLIGGDWGPENELHPHAYRIEVRLESDSLDPHGFIVDLVDLEAHLDRMLARYREQTLNELPEFDALNPSLEHFARILCQDLAAGLASTSLTAFQVTLWEDATAWAAYRQQT
ncbi:MAG TPA: 6-carboxytetrahydropterin synthase [Anaerolineales bacterium]|jgi:6-pyruvoyltetrahydropterin/6-carboxytetrahydropterin synthase|nr:6-carboxytetrahydropterin synthase [Anaerolineales bacterium]